MLRLRTGAGAGGAAPHFSSRVVPRASIGAGRLFMSTVQCRSLEAILQKRRRRDAAAARPPAKKRTKRMSERQVALAAYYQSKQWAAGLQGGPPLEPALDLDELGRVASEAERCGAGVVAVDLIELCRRRAEVQADRTARAERAKRAERAERAERAAAPNKKRDE